MRQRCLVLNIKYSVLLMTGYAWCQTVQLLLAHILVQQKEAIGSQDYTLHKNGESSHPDGHWSQTHGLHMYRLLSQVLEFTDVTCMEFYTTLGIMVDRLLWQGMVPCSISQNIVPLKKRQGHRNG